MVSKLISKALGFLMKNVMTENLVKSVVGVLGDYLVKSSKNKLDDMLWGKVKKNLGI
tara:strand:- start:235 stop:405 length:171 start_codon:yes stop_codon:yes gene_type:complete